jgi:hypothetical protein
MKTRPMIAAPVRWLATSGALVLAATLVVSGVTIGGDDAGQPFDPATQAAWLEQHFRCEHPAELAAGQPFDPATQAAWLEQHFRCEHLAELAAGQPFDPATQAAWLEQHFRCEHLAELAEA